MALLYLDNSFSLDMETITFESFTSKLEDCFEHLDKGSLTPDTKFRDLEDWTSINAMILIALYETEYDRRVTFDMLRRCETIRDLYALIN
jgi:acyl carrier protein